MGLGEVYEMIHKVEFESLPGPVCGIGPKGLSMLMNALGVHFGILMLGEMEDLEALPEPFCLVHHDNHWVPMWSKNVHGPYRSRPSLPLAAYDVYLDVFSGAAEQVF